ncbi:MAG: hypothetical protein A2V70_18420 [Planctomycetes bacterium RBG_13_63_9]|nr:MAG: hypothetical protein A2V70_18420 [Planctomycetes bacterium RBG_13_63_9]
MKGMGLLKVGLVSLAAVGFCLPQTVLAAGPATNRVPMVADVALSHDGVLIGQVVGAQGSALANVPVSVRLGNQEIARTTTDAHGRFALRGLRSGVYQIVAANSHRAFRLWQPGTAPPSSQSRVLLVAGQDTVRGQCGDPACAGCGEEACVESCGAPCNSGCSSLPCCLSNPWIVAGVVATAVAVPVIVHNSDRPSSP